ncbi:MAG: AAA family ATPase [Candidatus Aenigmarchaeota archaeon]|nr:AAA family ATPase [Candidatus Aenigmarchaeota archaeon]
MDYERQLRNFNWSSNPFTFQITPSIFVGYTKELNEMVTGLQSGNKFSLLLGPTGSGKTTMLKFLEQKFQDARIIYISKPPKDARDWVTVFERITKRRFPLRRKNINLYNLNEHVKKALKGKKLLLFVDECHEASLESLEWLRSLTDHVDSLSVVLAGLPVFESSMKSNLETFMRRVGTKIELGNLSRSETRELIKRRIEFSGGNDIRPFSHNIIDYVYDRTGGFPREVIRVCNELSLKAMEKQITTIDTDFLRETDAPEARLSTDRIASLPERQKLIIETLAKHGELTPAQIISKLDTEEYKDRENGVRSVNNVLRRLMKEKLVERKKSGKAYVYKVSDRFQTLLVQA